MQAIDELTSDQRRAHALAAAKRVDEDDQDAEDELPASAALDAKDLAFLRASSQIFALEKLEAQARADEAQRLLEDARKRWLASVQIVASWHGLEGETALRYEDGEPVAIGAEQ